MCSGVIIVLASKKFSGSRNVNGKNVINVTNTNNIIKTVTPSDKEK